MNIGFLDSIFLIILNLCCINQLKIVVGPDNSWLVKNWIVLWLCFYNSTLCIVFLLFSKTFKYWLNMRVTLYEFKWDVIFLAVSCSFLCDDCGLLQMQQLFLADLVDICTYLRIVLVLFIYWHPATESSSMYISYAHQERVDVPLFITSRQMNQQVWIPWHQTNAKIVDDYKSYWC